MLALAIATPLGVPPSNATPLSNLPLGVDYYPEQWPLSEMEDDMRSIKTDLGADTIRVGEFMWSALEPSDGCLLYTSPSPRD